ncbi:MAG: ornithine cyclodeaminase family protein [Bacteroidota bacterium]
MTLILNRDEVATVLNMKDCIDIVEAAFAELANGTSDMPMRSNIKPPGGLSLYMPAYLKEMKALACKVVTVYKDNPEKHDLPTTIGKVLLQDPESGDVICVMDGGFLTAMRTGAASGVATKYLARDEKGMTAGIFGTGVQAQMQLWAICEVRDITKALAYDINTAAAEKFAALMKEKLGIEVVVASSAEEVLNADIICTATSSPTPIFDGSMVKEGTHINGIGSHTPNARELDTVVIKRSKFIGDSREACFNEAGDIIIPVDAGEVAESHFYAELGELVTGRKDARLDDSEITIFKSNGLAIQDAATAKLVYDKAVERGIGTELRF